MRRWLLGIAFLSLGGEFPKSPRPDESVWETATFALGCFWGPDSRFGALPGVVRTRVGYCGGILAHPTYERPGDHSEAIQIDFDPRQVSYAQLLEVARQEGRFGEAGGKRQYRSAIFYRSAGQRECALRAGFREVEPERGFVRAEFYHQKYYLQQSGGARELLARYRSDEEFTDATVTARANGVVAGQLAPAQARRALTGFSLTPDGLESLLKLAERAQPTCR